ncbi:MAG: DUF4397 domain-containing protein [Propionibacteriaceae bacterium]
MTSLSVRSRTLFAALSTAALLAGTVAFATPAAAADTAQLSVLHALPGLTVDVYVDGKKKVDNLEPGELAGPLSVSSGSHKIVMVKSTAPSGEVPGIDLTAKVAANGNYSAVVYRDVAHQRVARLYRNNVDATPAGEGRLTVRHVAAAPAVDVSVDGKSVAKKLGDADQKSVELAAGTVEATVTAAGSSKAIVGPAGVAIAAGKTTVVYVWGNLDKGSQTIAVQAVDASASHPSSVDAGETGQAADRGIAPLAAGALALALGALALLRRARSTRPAGTRRGTR